ncbi:transglutaminase domain-containing protein [Candidatus Woesearchaeota archaeon]|nr:transglutaminase domain-containing protein [Candidatus Woesearchaeota archaeon]
MWKRKKKDVAVDAEAAEIEEMRKSLTSWGWKKRLCVAAAALTLAGTIGYGVCEIDKEFTRQDRYGKKVESSASRFRKKRPSAVASEACLRPGFRASVLEDYISMFGVTARKESLKIIDGKNVGGDFCIRPVDGSQDVSIESKVLVSGLEYSDFKGFVREEARLTISPKVPDILESGLKIISVSVNGKDIPVPYVTKEGCSCRKDGEAPYLDIAQLVDDGILGAEDFASGLEVRISSKLHVGLPMPFEGKDVAGAEAYKPIAGKIGQYLKSDSRFPASHRKIQKIVSDFGGKHDNVLEMMQYALDVTDAAIEYYLPELELNPVEALADGRGDCDDYASIFVTIMRGFGVPARYVEGNVTNEKGDRIDGGHAWAEVLVPLKDGSYRWVLVEPTWADNKKEPYAYINYVNHKHLYGADFSVLFDTSKRDRLDVMVEHELVSAPVLPDFLNKILGGGK